MLTAKWATPMLQKKAFGEAWLGFLRLEVPDDVFRKVPFALLLLIPGSWHDLVC